jgi:Uma2 family endonuclease
MIQTVTTPVTFERFLEWKPEGGRYELHDGTIVEMQPSGKHEGIIAELALTISGEILRLKLPYRIPKQVLIKPPTNDTAYSPDVLLINTSRLSSEPLWEKFSTLTQGASVPLVIEVVSTNWRDDYLKKVADYEQMGISEYWIVDYLGLGGRRFIGDPKQPTLSIYYLEEGEYQVSQFRGSDRIVSPLFPNLDLTARQAFQIE